jgi:hypothetical protein
MIAVETANTSIAASSGSNILHEGVIITSPDAKVV